MIHSISRDSVQTENLYIILYAIVSQRKIVMMHIKSLYVLLNLIHDHI